MPRVVRINHKYIKQFRGQLEIIMSFSGNVDGQKRTRGSGEPGNELSAEPEAKKPKSLKDSSNSKSLEAERSSTTNEELMEFFSGEDFARYLREQSIRQPCCEHAVCSIYVF